MPKTEKIPKAEENLTISELLNQLFATIIIIIFFFTGGQNSELQNTNIQLRIDQDSIDFFYLFAIGDVQTTTPEKQLFLTRKTTLRN